MAVPGKYTRLTPQWISALPLLSRSVCSDGAIRRYSVSGSDRSSLLADRGTRTLAVRQQTVEYRRDVPMALASRALE